MQIIDSQLLDELYAKAEANPRLRMNLNFHDALEAPAQRLLNALAVGTQVPIHRHTATAETYILLRGKLAIKFYNDKREVTEMCVLEPLSGKHGVHIPAGTWHALEVLAEGTVIFEVKDGPYRPLAPDDILA